MKLSRSALDQFIRCPRCFYQQRKLGLKQPSMVPLTLAVATDALLKNEFDAIRGQDVTHAVWQEHGLKVRAYAHPDIDVWRNNFKGIRVRHSCGAEVYGAVDDLWENLDTGEIHVVDYKSTSKQGEPSIDVGWGDGYKRQMEIYQWLFRQAGFNVSHTGYFLYVNASKQGGFFDSGTEGVMRFATTLIPYVGDDGWVGQSVAEAVKCFNDDNVPESGSGCDNCRYFDERLALI